MATATATAMTMATAMDTDTAMATLQLRLQLWFYKDTNKAEMSLDRFFNSLCFKLSVDSH